MPIDRDIFDELFVLELANNHWGSLERGLQIIHDFGRVVRYNGVRAAIKLQFRDIDTFVHRDYRHRTDIRYIGKTLATKLSQAEIGRMVDAIRATGCIPMATPFDEHSVDLCVKFGMPIVKLASSDLNDWVLIERLAKTRKPIIASTGGSSVKDVDDLVTFYENRSIPLAINHCVSLYPCEDEDLQLNQIDYLRGRYPGVTIGFSTHEYTDWETSVAIAYGKGARTFERHIDIERDEIPVSPYCSTPDQADRWFRAFARTKAMCGPAGTSKRIPGRKETEYLEALVRGVYAARDLPEGHELTAEDYYLAVPLLRGQLSCRELIEGERLTRALRANAPVALDAMDTPYARSPEMLRRVARRGLDPVAEPGPPSNGHAGASIVRS